MHRSMPTTAVPARVRRSRWVRAVAASCLLTAATPASSRPAPQDAALPDIQKLGPQIGERVPAFTLQDQHGQSRTLEALLGEKGTMLVFFRSADW